MRVWFVILKLLIINKYFDNNCGNISKVYKFSKKISNNKYSFKKVIPESNFLLAIPLLEIFNILSRAEGKYYVT